MARAPSSAGCAAASAASTRRCAAGACAAARASPAAACGPTCTGAGLLGLPLPLGVLEPLLDRLPNELGLAVAAALEDPLQPRQRADREADRVVLAQLGGVSSCHDPEEITSSATILQADG